MFESLKKMVPAKQQAVVVSEREFLPIRDLQKVVRKYAAAQINRLNMGWITSPSTIDADIRGGLTSLRARSREEAQNNGYYKGFLRDLRENVVGAQGFQLISKPMDSDTVIDIEAKNSIERHWKIWGKKQNRPELSGIGFNNPRVEVSTDRPTRNGMAYTRYILNFDKELVPGDYSTVRRAAAGEAA